MLELCSKAHPAIGSTAAPASKNASIRDMFIYVFVSRGTILQASTREFVENRPETSRRLDPVQVAGQLTRLRTSR